jgi:hypothetical protein
MTGYWMQTSTGAAIDILDPDPASIQLMDIAISLSRLPRFTGHTKPAVTANVAEHSLLVERLAPFGTSPVARLHLLFHDAHEMITADISSPLKSALKFLAGGYDWVEVISRRIQHAIEVAANLPKVTADEYALIKRLDIEALAIEKRDCMAPEPQPWLPLPDVSEQPIDARPIGEAHARAAFRGRALSLFCDAGIHPRHTFLEGI